MLHTAGGGGEGRVGGESFCRAWPQSYVPRPSRLYNTGKEHAGFSPRPGRHPQSIRREKCCYVNKYDIFIYMLVAASYLSFFPSTCCVTRGKLLPPHHDQDWPPIDTYTTAACIATYLLKPYLYFKYLLLVFCGESSCFSPG